MGASVHATYNQTDDASVTFLVLNEFARFSVKDKSETLSSTICNVPSFERTRKYMKYFAENSKPHTNT